MDSANRKIVGILLLGGGLLLALTFGGNVGFSGSVYSGLAYIGGFVIAFIGAYITFIMGRTRNRED